MKNTRASLLALLALGATSLVASAQIVQNDDFTANAAAFTESPGYSGPSYAGSGNGPITDWASSAPSSTGINGSDTGVGNVFGAGDPPPAYAFIQGNNNLTQTISLHANYTYSISFLSGPRPTAGELIDGMYVVGPQDLADGEVLIEDPLTRIAYETVAGNNVNGSNFTTETGTFKALGNSAILTLENGQTSGKDTTANFSDIVITQIGTPEPSTYILLGLGMLVLIVVGRSAARKA